MVAGIRTYRIADSRTYLVASRKYDVGAYWLVTVRNGRPDCHCPGMRFHGACAHEEAVVRRLARERRKRKIT